MVRTGGRRYKRILRKFLKWISLLAFLASVGMIIKLIFLDPKAVERDQNEAKGFYYNQENYNKFSKLTAINSDIKGWISINGTVIDYPVLQREDDPGYYLGHNYKGEKSRYGSIFIGSGQIQNENCRNIVLHGHNMRDGQMFAAVTKFLNLDFYKEHPTVEFDTPTEKSIYKVLYAFRIEIYPTQSAVVDYTKWLFSDPGSFEDFINVLKRHSVLDVPVDINDDDKLLTLSTCSNDESDTRTVVVARKVRDGESADVDTENAVYMQNPERPVTHRFF